MEMETAPNRNRRILLVDDEPVALQQLTFQLNALGCDVSAATSSREAQALMIREGPGVFDCLIADFWMPEQTGLDLLFWLRYYDNTLASIVISKAADKELLTQTLRGGASDFLEKPVIKEDLERALGTTILSTQRRRRHAATRSAVREAGLVQRRMNNLGLLADLPASLTICYHPCHDAGGDSVAFFSPDPAEILIVVADVSGHDLKSAFISAYFQGMLRGMVEQNIPIRAALEHFNSFLVREWSRSPGEEHSESEITSLSVCSASIDLSAGSVRLLNSGFPVANRVDQYGQSWVCGETGGYPLGWFDPNPISELTIQVDSTDHLVVWTDGLEEFANRLQISEWSLAFRILQAKQNRQTPTWLAEAPDDVLLAVIGFVQETGYSYPFPILAESYGKAQVEDIDEIQERWRRTLEFAFPELPQDGLSDILLCARESVLNGLMHGCSKESDRCRLTMAFDIGQKQLQVDAIDPGPGHNFDFNTRAAGELLDSHRGVLLMHILPHRVEQDSTGAAIRMFFVIEHEPVMEQK